MKLKTYMKNRDRIMWVYIIVMLYFAAAGFTFAIRHPEMTQTQRFLNFWNVVTWVDLNKSS